MDPSPASVEAPISAQLTVSATLLLFMFVVGVVFSVKNIKVIMRTAGKERSQPYFGLLLAIQIWGMSSLLFPILFVLMLVFSQSIFSSVFGVAAIVIQSSPTQICLVDFLLCMQRSFIYFEVHNILLSNLRSLIVYVILSIPVTYIASVASLYIGASNESRTMDMEFFVLNSWSINLKTIFLIDLLMRFSLSLISVVAYSYMLKSVKRSTRHSRVKRTHDYMIVVQAMPISAFELVTVVLQALSESLPTTLYVQTYRQVFVMVTSMSSSVVVPLSISLGNTTKRKLFFNCCGSSQRQRGQISDGRTQDSAITPIETVTMRTNSII